MARPDALAVKRRLTALVLGAGVALAAGPAHPDSAPAPEPAPPRMNHALRIVLGPAAHRLAVTDRIRVPEETDPALEFMLHAGFDPRSPTPGVSLTPLGTASLAGGIAAERFRVTLPAGKREFVLRYRGELHHPVHEGGEDYARRIGDTAGAIGSDGVYLDPGAGWYPVFDASLVSFALEVDLPEGWTAVSQGRRTANRQEADRRIVRWESLEPQPGLWLIAARFEEYGRASGEDGVEAMAFLRAPDPELADRYLDVTGAYLEMYARLLGPYPYAKFAVVENFWETGYGMPSFTLLGPRVIRFPFILHTSYPHEILHNWWGNGVFVDAASGNWSEGLTAYLADHLGKEQRGAGAEYRETSLQKYADYVSSERDFALRDFRARHGSASEAVGYAKMMMLAHMLRLELGDETFVAGLRDFYRENRFRRASFTDLERAFSSAAGRDLTGLFSQWVERAGAPRLRIRRAEAASVAGAPVLNLELEQTQSQDAYRLRVPVVVTVAGAAEAHATFVRMEARTSRHTIPVSGRPLRVDVDPDFDVFRRLDPREVPPALTRAFGAEKVTVLLPRAAPPARLDAYRALAKSWSRHGESNVEVRLDDVATLPEDRSVWLFGWQNALLPRLRETLEAYGGAASAEGLRLAEAEYPSVDHAVALTVSHPASAERALAWFAASHPEAVPRLGRRLPHFHKYSYLVFAGAEATNVAKGRWPVLDSPMTVWLAGADGRVQRVEPPARPPRPPLVALPAAFGGG